MDVEKIVFLLIVSLAFAELGIVVASLLVIYPIEAEERGASPFQYGLVLGCAPLASVIFTPLYGLFGHIMKPKNILFLGGVTAGASSVLFGTLEFVHQSLCFVSFSAILQFIIGLGLAACNASITMIVSHHFPENIATLSAAIINVYLLGMAIGPTTGSLLHSTNGFGFNFYILGSICIILTFFLRSTISRIGSSHNYDCNEEFANRPDDERTLKAIEMFKNPLFLCPLIDNFYIAFGFGMIESMLTMHLLATTDSTETDIGFAFSLQGICCLIFGIFPGMLADRMQHPVLLSLLGNIIALFFYSFLGPAPYLSIEPSLIITYLILGGHGFCMGLITTSTLARLHNAVKILHFVNDNNAGMLISAYWLGAHYLGIFLGSTLGGIGVDTFGFPSTTVLFQVGFLGAIFSDIFDIFLISFKPGRSNKNDYETFAAQ